jgi:hypothetical protein
MFLHKLASNKSFVLAALTFILFVFGFALLHFGLVSYGWIFFLAYPVLVGLIVGDYIPNAKKFSLSIGIVILFLLILLALNFEGLICVIMALIYIIPMFFIGVLIHKLIKHISTKNTNNLQVNFLLLILWTSIAVIDKKTTDSNQVVHEVKSEMILNYDRFTINKVVNHMDTVIAPKSMLMLLNLPIPNKCILYGDTIGAKRTCYFSGGYIDERVTRIIPGKELKLDITDYHLTGRKWLGFREAIYYFDSLAPNKTKITRISTYTSELGPRFYWEPIEKWGIKDEHEYVLFNIKRQLELNNN